MWITCESPSLSYDSDMNSRGEADEQTPFTRPVDLGDSRLDLTKALMLAASLEDAALIAKLLADGRGSDLPESG